jgi:hypothetical protein
MTHAVHTHQGITIITIYTSLANRKHRAEQEQGERLHPHSLTWEKQLWKA